MTSSPKKHVRSSSSLRDKGSLEATSARLMPTLMQMPMPMPTQTPVQMPMSTMVRTLALMLTAAPVLQGCEPSSHLVGESGSASIDGSSVFLEHLVVSLADSYECAAGVIEALDSASTCNCDAQSWICDGSPPIDCLCDPDCYEARPMIDCADYSATFRLNNAADKAIDRMTRLSIRIGSFEWKEGGLACNDPLVWRLDARHGGGIVAAAASYGGRRRTRLMFEYPCLEVSGEADIGSARPGTDGSSSSRANLGPALPPAVGVGGEAVVSIEGLFADGAPWKAEATASVQ